MQPGTSKVWQCLVHSVVTDWFYTALSRLWQSSARLEIWLNALWKISVLAFFSSPYSYINLFLSCLVIKRTTPHFDSAPVHNGAEYFVISHFVIDFLLYCLLWLFRTFSKFSSCYWLNKFRPVKTIWWNFHKFKHVWAKVDRFALKVS